MIATSQPVITYLLAEDNDDHADLVERCFHDGNLPGQIRRVNCGADCLAYLDWALYSPDREQDPYPDVVLMDIRMAGTLDGLHTLQAIRANPRHLHLHVMMLTSSDRSDDVNRADELGADGYVVKSPDPNEMIENLRRVAQSFNSENS
jgi:CheY-like chemotaxis protein